MSPSSALTKLSLWNEGKETGTPKQAKKTTEKARVKAKAERAGVAALNVARKVRKDTDVGGADLKRNWGSKARPESL